MVKDSMLGSSPDAHGALDFFICLLIAGLTLCTVSRNSEFFQIPKSSTDFILTATM